MIAQRFRHLGWAAGVATAATALYLVSLQVAAERGKLEAVESQIADARRELRALQTELGSRASLRQLEAWNGEVLSLAAPKAKQFAASAAELTALDLDEEHGPAAASPPRALLAEATTAVPIVPAVVPALSPPVVQTKAAAPAAPAVKRKAKPEAAPVRTAAVKAKDAKAPAKPQRVAMLDATAMRDVARAAAREGRTRP